MLTQKGTLLEDTGHPNGVRGPDTSNQLMINSIDFDTVL